MYGTVVVFIMAGFFIRYPLPDAAAKLTSLLGSLFLFGGAFGAGDLILKRLKIETDRFWNFIFSIAAGLGILSLSVLLTGWLPLGTLSGRLTALEVGWFILFLIGSRELYHSLRDKSLFPASLPFFNVFCFALIFLAAGICLITAFSPITYYDSLVYHLALPSYYLIEGKITPAAFNLYSFFPANTEMLFLFILARLPQPEYVINLVTWGISLLISVAVFAWTKEIRDAKSGWLAATLWWTMPAVLLLSVGGYIEIPLAFYSFLTLRTFEEARRKNYDAQWVLLSGLMGGFSFASKYTGVIAPLFVGLLLIFHFFRREKLSLKTIGLFSAAVTAPIFPWLVRNAFAVGNPFFPFFYRFFGGDVGWTQESAGAYFQMLTEYGGKSSVFFELLRAPFDMAWNATKFGGGFDVLGDFGWPLLVLTAPLGLLLFGKSKNQRWLSIYFVVHSLIWFFTKPVLRFLVGVLPLAVLIGAAGFKHYLTTKKGLVSYIGYLSLGLFVLSNFYLYFFISDAFRPFDVALGQNSRQEFLRKRLSFYDAYNMLNNKLMKTDRVFLLGEQRAYHLKVPYISASIFAPSPIARFCNAEENPFIKENVTHVLIHAGEIERLGGLEKFGFSETGKRFFQAFLEKNYHLIYSQNRISVYEKQERKTS